MRKFMPHQQRAFDYAKDRARIALFMEMRLGKTMVAIRWVEHWKLKRVLVVAPLAVLRSWEEELLSEEYAYEDLTFLVGDAETRSSLARTSGMWFLINYEGLLATPGILELNWDGIILDESTRIRNPQAKITKLLSRASYRISKRAILSGLPNPESSMDYYEQMKFCWDSFMHEPNFWMFRKRYFQQFGYEWFATKFTQDKIKEEVHKLAFVLTRAQAGIKARKVYEKRYVPMNPEQTKLQKQIQEGFEFTNRTNELQETKWIPVQYQWYGRIAGGFSPDGRLLSNAKFEELYEMLRGELKGEPVVVWFRYTQELEQVALQLKARGLKVGSFTGATKGASEEFKAGNIQILCAQGRCGQYGLDWSRASTAIYFSNWYDGEVRAQSEDRIVHPKKNDVLLYIDLVTEDSIDEDVVELLRTKKLNSKLFAMELAKKWAARTKLRLTLA